jgi:predicted enzyme related to lactoylglutathione lyase
MVKVNARLAGVELYFDDLLAAKQFYAQVLGLPVIEEAAGHHVQFHGGSTFLCLEAKGREDYPSLDKAVIFVEVPNLRDAIEVIGENRIVKQQPAARGRPAWAVLHDPEGHNILLLEPAPDAHS